MQRPTKVNANAHPRRRRFASGSGLCARHCLRCRRHCREPAGKRRRSSRPIAIGCAAHTTSIETVAEMLITRSRCFRFGMAAVRIAELDTALREHFDIVLITDEARPMTRAASPTWMTGTQSTRATRSIRDVADDGRSDTFALPPAARCLRRGGDSPILSRSRPGRFIELADLFAARYGPAVDSGLHDAYGEGDFGDEQDTAFVNERLLAYDAITVCPTKTERSSTIHARYRSPTAAPPCATPIDRRSRRSCCSSAHSAAPNLEGILTFRGKPIPRSKRRFPRSG